MFIKQLNFLDKDGKIVQIINGEQFKDTGAGSYQIPCLQRMAEP